MGVDIGPLLRKVTSRHPSLVWWSSWLLGRDIYVPPMSDAWLRTHEEDWNKHGVDL
jgi:hypothetical protein